MGQQHQGKIRIGGGGGGGDPLHRLLQAHRAEQGCGGTVELKATAGGGFQLNRAAAALFGPVSLEQSVQRITAAAAAADPDLPLVLLAHCGPTGLGSDVADPCGRDWKRPACDWGDQDLALAIDRIRRLRPLPLVVFGHMHHRLKRGQGERRSFCVDRAGTAYLNTAFVPRHSQDERGQPLRHFSWVVLRDGQLREASHRWYGLDGRLLYQHTLLSPAAAELQPC